MWNQLTKPRLFLSVPPPRHPCKICSFFISSYACINLYCGSIWEESRQFVLSTSLLIALIVKGIRRKALALYIHWLFFAVGIFLKNKTQKPKWHFSHCRGSVSFHVHECSLRQKDLCTCHTWGGRFIGWRLPFHDPCFWVELRLYQKALLREDFGETQ